MNQPLGLVSQAGGGLTGPGITGFFLSDWQPCPGSSVTSYENANAYSTKSSNTAAAWCVMEGETVNRSYDKRGTADKRQI